MYLVLMILFLRDVELKTARRKQAIKAFHGLICNSTLLKENKQQIFQSIIINIPLHGAQLKN